MLSHHTQDAFGQPYSSVSSSDPYQGRGAQAAYYRDSETGLYLCTNRYYDPVNARFLNRDPIGYAGGNNLYAYVGSNPIGRLDPSGLDWDLYDWTVSLSVRGYQRGGFLGHAQAEIGNGLVAFYDTIGGRTVADLAGRSGDANGRGAHGEAALWGLATVGYIGLEAFTFGRAGAMVKAPLKGCKEVGTEFSHFISKATMKRYPIWRQTFSEPSIFNGRVVSVAEHAATDAARFRFLAKEGTKGLTKQTVKQYGFVRSTVNRSPLWLQFFGFRAGTSAMGGSIRF